RAARSAARAVVAGCGSGGPLLRRTGVVLRGVAPICPLGIFPRRAGEVPAERGMGAPLRSFLLGRALGPGGPGDLRGGLARLRRGRGHVGRRSATARRLRRAAPSTATAAVADLDHLALATHFEQADRFDQVAQLAVAMVAGIERALVADVAADRAQLRPAILALGGV